jgi:hypothetical protein
VWTVEKKRWRKKIWNRKRQSFLYLDLLSLVPSLFFLSHVKERFFLHSMFFSFPWGFLSKAFPFRVHVRLHPKKGFLSKQPDFFHYLIKKT